jgi:hypothetical protein
MWTSSYKGIYLHGYFGSNVVQLTWPEDTMPSYFKSLRAAKWRITRYLRRAA